jgi:phosphonate transport system substrate-binding protein
MLDRRRLTLLLTGAVLARPAIAQAPQRLVFTAIPDQDETRLVERFGRVAAYLQDALGVPVLYVPVKSYPAAVTAFTNNQCSSPGSAGSPAARRGVPSRALRR